MTRFFTTALIAAAAAASTAAHAAKPDDLVGPYVGAAVGASSFQLRDVGAAKISSDESDRAYKIYGGYQLTERYGVELGYVRLGKLEDRFNVGGTTVRQSATGRSLYVAGTGRLPLGESFALTGKLGVAFNKVTGSNVLSASDSLIGSKTSPMLAFGAEYRLSRDLALTVDLDGFGKLSRKVSAAAVTAGLRYSF